MKDWEKIYQERLMSADEAVKLVHSGDRVVTTHATGEAKHLTQALCRRAQELEGVKIWQGLNWGDAQYGRPEYAGHLIIDSVFLGPASREAINKGYGAFTPGHVSLFRRAFEETVPVDGFLANLTPPDEDGYCNMGVSVDFGSPAADNARYIIGMINPSMPWICGEHNKIHVSRLAAIVEHDEPLLNIPPIDDTDPVSTKIGENIARLVEDGACLQMGQGKVPNAILKCLSDKRDLGVHTEVFSDSLVPLIEAGVITCNAKQINRGKVVSMFIQGSSELYRYVARNDLIQMMPCWYTNDPRVISQNDKVTAINAAIEIDLSGQVNCEFNQGKYWSGIGGQVDFIRGAAMSKGGKPIICLPATAKHGSVSRIVPVLPQGTPVSTPRYDVHWVVTEYGAVNLFGRSLRERAELLTGIAAPQFRDQLWNAWEEQWREIARR